MQEQETVKSSKQLAKKTRGKSATAAKKADEDNLESTDKVVVGDKQTEQLVTKSTRGKSKSKTAQQEIAIESESVQKKSARAKKGAKSKETELEVKENVEENVELEQLKSKRNTAASKKQQQSSKDEVDAAIDHVKKKASKVSNKKTAADLIEEEQQLDEQLDKQLEQLDKQQEKEEESKEIEEPFKVPVKKGRGKAKAAITTTVNKEKEETAIVSSPQTTTKRGRRPIKKDQQEQLQEEEINNEPVETQSQPIESVTTKRGRRPTKKDQQEQLQEEEINNEPVETQSQPIESVTTKRGRRPTKKDQQEQLQEEEIDNEPVETQSQPIESVTTKRGRRPTKKDQQEQLQEEEIDNEPVETQSQPIESVTTKRGRRPTKKIIENEEQSDKVIEQPATKSTRGKKAAVVPVEDKIIEKEKVKEAEDDQEKMNKLIEDDEEDNKSEKELVIDLKEDQPPAPPPPPKKRGRKVYEREAAAIKANEIETQKQQLQQVEELQPTVSLIEQQKQSPVVKRGRGKGRKAKQQEEIINQEEVPSSELPTTKSKSDKNKDSTPIEEEQITSSNLQQQDEELERPAKRGKHDDEIVAEEEEVINNQQLQEESSEVVAEEKEEEMPCTSNSDELNKEEKELEESKAVDETTSSQGGDSRQDVMEVIETMKSMVEESILDPSSSSLNETRGEVISAKELEEYTSDSEDLKLTYDSITLKNYNFSETSRTNELACTSNTISFTRLDNETNARKRIKLFDIKDKLKLPAIDNGKVIAFGEDMAGELGLIKSGIQRHWPIEIKVDKQEEFCFINTLSQHSVCVNKKGELYTFGNNDEFALGRLTNLDANSNEEDDEEDNEQDRQDRLNATPTIFNFGEFKVYKATTGDSHTAALTTCGSVFYWGNFRDTNGSAGLTTSQLTPTNKPVAIDQNLDIIDIASGANFLLLLDSSGVVYSLGVGDRGELGRFATEAECKFNKQQRAKFLEPLPVEFAKNVQIDAIWASEFNAFARSTDNRVFGWGLNNYCQLGFNKQENGPLSVFKPKEINYFTKLNHRIEKIACGQHHSIALDNRGNVFAFGRHEYGRLGLGNVKEDANQPKLIESLKGKKVIDISCGASSSFAITEDGQLYSWGMASPQLGHGKNVNENDIWEPRQVKSEDKSKVMQRFKAIKVAAGSNHCLVLGHLTEEDVNNNKQRNGVI